MTANTIEKKKRAAEILLVDDNRGDMLLTQLAFKETGLATNLSGADSAEAALAMLRDPGAGAVPDLILLDLNLPRMQGHEFLKLLKSDPALRHLPVVVLSSSQAMGDVVESYSHYASGYIVKPTGFEEFRKLALAIEDYFFKLVTLPDMAPKGKRHA